MGITFAYNIGEPDINFLRAKIEPGSIVYDVGANVGRYTLHLSETVGETGQVIALEPVKNLTTILKQNIEMNEIENTVLIPAAAAEENGAADFAYSPEDSTLGMLEDPLPSSYQPPGTGTVEVQTVQLDEVAKEMGVAPDVIKLDVQGAAGPALRGAEHILEVHEPDIYVELHVQEEQQAVQDELLDRGYAAKDVEGKVIEDPTDHWVNPLWCTK
jgi:FkbM family methyltransferase